MIPCSEDPIYVDPQLEGLADNGGYNFTMALQSGSPAIDAGAVGCPGTVQRGASRVDQCDTGAFEFGGTPAIPPAELDQHVYVPVVHR